MSTFHTASESHAIPPAEFAVTPDLVRQLLSEQAPHLAHHPLRVGDEGWDNVMIRIGSDLAARLPRRAGAVPLLLTEQAWLDRIAAAIPIPVPAPVVLGRPGCGYPWHWSVVPWRAGTRLGAGTLARGAGRSLARALLALHRIDPTGAPVSPVRGGALRDRDSAVTPRLERLAHADWHGHSWMGGIQQLWQAALASAGPMPSTQLHLDRQTATASPTGQLVLLHGDLHPGNVIVDGEGALVSLVDWGDLCAGDPATDIAALWLLLPDATEREGFLALYPCDPALLARARGWAINLASALVETGLGSGAPVQVATGTLIFQRLWDETSGRTGPAGASASLPAGADRL